MRAWQRAAERSWQALGDAAADVGAEARTAARWIHAARGGDRDALLRAMSWGTENTARAAMAATRRVEATCSDAWRCAGRTGPWVIGAVGMAGALVRGACHAVVTAAVAYDLISNTKRTEEVD